MATPFSDIYDLNEAITNDEQLNDLPTNLYYFILYQYLQFAIAEFEAVCNQDINTFTSFSQTLYEFEGDGNEVNFTLSPAPTSGSELYVSVDDVENTDYTYNSTTNIITFNTAPISGADIYVGAYIIGEFPVTLTINEKRILTEGMIIPYRESKLNKSAAFDQIVFGSNVNFHSQANHNKVLTKSIDEQRRLLHIMISKYSWRSSDDDLEGLLGEPSG